MTFNLEKQCSIIIGFLNNNNILETEILINLKDNNLRDDYFKKFSLKGYSFVENFKFKNENKISIS